MKQTGYLIENLLDKSKYFTTTSSYDRPQWVSRDKAAVYETADSAERAMKKMIKYGVNSIRMVNLAEFAAPVRRELPPEDEMSLPPMDGEELPPEDEMVAGHQEVVCPQCNHEPCTCDVGDHPEGEELDLDDPNVLPPTDGEELPMDGEELPPEGELNLDELPPEENEEITNRTSAAVRGHTVSYKGEQYVVNGEVGNGVFDLTSVENPSKRVRAHGAELMSVRESEEQKDNCICSEPDASVTVPASVKSALAAVVSKFTKEADEYNNRDDARASFAMTVASAADELKVLLDKGTVESLKLAQVKLASFMNPITSNFPVEVHKFILSGGRKQSLKDLFDSKRAK